MLKDQFIQKLSFFDILEVIGECVDVLNERIQVDYFVTSKYFYEIGNYSRHFSSLFVVLSNALRLF